MNYKLLFAALSLALLTLSGCGATVKSYSHVEKVDMDVYAAPEHRAAGSYLEPGSHTTRLSATLNLGYDSKEKVTGIRNKKGDCSDIEKCKGAKDIDINENLDLTYHLKNNIVNGYMDYLTKSGSILWGFNIGVNRGFDAAFILGINTEHFEAGATAGLWYHQRVLTYSSTEYWCSFYLSDDTYGDINERESISQEEVGFDFIYGGYISLFVSNFSLNYSVSIYTPDSPFPTDKGSELHGNFEMPLVMTNYFSLGYRLNKRWEARMGASNTYGEFPGWHWEINSSASFYFM